MIDKVTPFQRKILSELADLEIRISLLYKAYEALFPAAASFWGDMAKEEVRHAAMLLSLNKDLDEGHVFWNIGQFNEAVIKEQRDLIDAELKRTHDYNVTVHDALDAAIRIENSLLESHFYSTVKSSSTAFPHIAKALTIATQTHLRKLQAHIVESGGGQVWL